MVEINNNKTEPSNQSTRHIGATYFFEMIVGPVVSSFSTSKEYFGSSVADAVAVGDTALRPNEFRVFPSVLVDSDSDSYP
jgi:hypothetical protein